MSETEVVLHQGDCLEAIPNIVPPGVAMVFADLPYATKKRKHTDHPWDVPFSLDKFWPTILSVGASNAAYIFTAAQPFTSHLTLSNLAMFKYSMVWDKRFSGSFSTAKFMPLRTHEDVLVFCKGKTHYTPQMSTRAVPIISGANRIDKLSRHIRKANPDYTRRVHTEKHPVSILQFSNRVDKRGFHPTQKPVALLEFLIKSYTREGDTILDPVAGSGSTALAALNVGNRKVICIEKDPAYFEVMSKRVAEHKEKLRVK